VTLLDYQLPNYDFSSKIRHSIEKQSMGNQMARGGRREGAGRKKGVPNKISQSRIMRAALTGEMPLDFMLRLMRGERVNGKPLSINDRINLAVACAPYVHHRLAPIKVSLDESEPLATDDGDQLPDFTRPI
jgi:hypothetical protein